MTRTKLGKMVILTVVIPTRNRSAMLASLLKTCQKSKSDEVEFVVADNSDNPENLNFLDLDSRFKIVRSTERIGMTANWGFGLEHATGNWRVFVGDDDGILPEELDKLIVVLRQATSEAVVCRFAHFYWPKEGSAKGRISIWLDSEAPVHWTGLQGNPYSDFTNINFPIPYCRTVFHKLLEERIRGLQGGRLFTATSPDINLGAAISLASESIDYLPRITPFIVGTSALSNGLQGPQGVTKRDFQALNSHQWIPQLGNESFATNYMSYLEPIAQARKARGLPLELPPSWRIIWLSLVSTSFYREVILELRSLFPRKALMMLILYPAAVLMRRVIRVTGLIIWATKRALINREFFVSEKSMMLYNIETASSKLQSILTNHRQR